VRVLENKDISMAVVKRLPRYYRYLDDLLENGITRVSSMELSRKMNTTASQIRQDLNNFGNFGQQGYGYHVEMLRDEIQKILRLDRVYHLILIGVGSLGQALLHFEPFQKHGYHFIGLFDTDPKLIGTSMNGVEIMHVCRMESFLRDNSADIAVLTLPEEGAKNVIDVLVSAGVKGLWNFTQTEPVPGTNIKVQDVRLTDSLMTLSYLLGGEKNA
jgi:redox-sensing transcriptional repressor